MESQISFKPLDMAIELIEAAGFEVGYFYDDLVFANPAAFLLQFSGEDPSQIFLHINAETHPDSRPGLVEQFKTLAADKKVNITEKGTYELSQTEGKEEFTIRFS